MEKEKFLLNAKCGHGECVIELRKGNINEYRKQVEKVFLNNYAFLKKYEYRSSYAYEMIHYYHEDYYFLKKLWAKILRINLDNDYQFIYLIDNLYFILKHNKNFLWINKIKHLLTGYLYRDFFTINENNSICAIIAIIYDLRLKIDVDEIINSHFCKCKNSNLDLSSINFFYRKSLKSSCNKNMNTSFENMDLSGVIDYIKCNLNLGYETVLISHQIQKKDISNLIDVLFDFDVEPSIKNNVLQIIFYSGNCSIENVENLIKYANICETIGNKILVYDIILNIKSKKVFKMLISKKIDDSLYVMLALNNYDYSFYAEIHKRIKKISINYNDNSMWYEIESELIRYFKKRKVDLRLLEEVRFFLNYGLCSTSRLNLVLILKKYNMLKSSDIEHLKYDANCDIRHLFE